MKFTNEEYSSFVEKTKKYSSFVEKTKNDRKTKAWKLWRAEMLGNDPKCEACGSTEKLAPHHKKRVKPGELYIGAQREDILILCKRCHFGIHHHIGYCSKCDHMTPGSVFDKTLICKRHPGSSAYKRNQEWLKVEKWIAECCGDD